jgi:hypothetical protein
MPEYRYYCLDAHGKIVLGRHIDAPDLPTAIHMAARACALHPNGPFDGIEVWEGAKRLYASNPNHNGNDTPAS